LAIYPLTPKISSPVVVHYDGITLVKGIYPTDVPPQFEGSQTSYGTWGGQQFQNLIRNAFAEKTWPGFKPWIEKIFANRLPFNISDIWIMLDWKSVKGYLVSTGGILFRTFWAKFGWGQVPLLGTHPYRVLGYITLLGLFSVLPLFIRKRSIVFSPTGLVLVLATMGIVWLTIARGAPSLFDQINFERVLYPVSRYLYPAIFPILLILNAGWHQVFDFLSRYVPHIRRIYLPLLVSFFFCLDAYSIYSIVVYYKG
jgi:hypothetical protein